MEFTTQAIAGIKAIQALLDGRASYPETGVYPFLIGDQEELTRIGDCDSLNPDTPESILAQSFNIKVESWIASKMKDLLEDGITADGFLGEWPEEEFGHGSIGLHKDVLSGAIKSEVFLGFARIREPWHLPAIVKYGAWNDCPEPAVHCAFHRHWLCAYGAEIIGMSGDIIECSVRKPPSTKEAALALACEQYWYCADIVEQGCQSISNLASTLMNSDYWYFWWD